MVWLYWLLFGGLLGLSAAVALMCFVWSGLMFVGFGFGVLWVWVGSDYAWVC